MHQADLLLTKISCISFNNSREINYQRNSSATNRLIYHLAYHAWCAGEPDCNPSLRFSLQVKVQVSGVFFVGLDRQKVIANGATAAIGEREDEPIILWRVSL